MGCPSCGAETAPAAKFCQECGTRLATGCPRCGHEADPSAKFCQECGTRLEATSPPRRDAAPVPQAYTPRHLAEKILAGRAALEGERKQVTVLFADVVGSTELIRDLDTEEAQRLLDGAVERMMAAVHRYEGTVSRLMGDGLMAIFGAPIAHEDHAVRACYAALAMQDAIRRYADELRHEYGLEVEIRVGMNSGEVVVRLISDDLHMDYTAMGQTVHLASRMEGSSAPGTALLSPATRGLVEGFVEVRPLGPTPVKGLEQLVHVYELVGAGTVRTRLQAAAARGFTRFVGRQRELEMIQAALARARRGHGQVVALVGEPGIGKSRLVYEVVETTRASGWQVLQSGAVSYGKATPYLPIVDLLKSSCQIQPGDDAEAICGQVTRQVLAVDQTLDTILTPLLALLDLPTDDASWVVLDPPRRRRATLDAVKRWLLRLSQERPLLLVLEDLHWIDSETQALLDELVEAVPAARMLLLVNYRPDYSHGWGNRSVYTQARVDPLETVSADQLLRSQLGEDSSLDPLKRHLIERTGGNPLFLEESVRSLMEIGVLVGQRGSYALTRDVSNVSVPATVQVILAARIDRLEPEEKRLLQTAAVVGKDVPFALLQAIAGTPESELHASLARLQAAELLYSVSLFPELQYTFKHALTHEVAYGSLLQDRRRALHARIVAAIERLHADRLNEHVERLAHHAIRGELWTKALAFLRRAGAKAMARSAYREAASNFEQALEALTHLSENQATLEQAVDLRCDLIQPLHILAQRERVLHHLEEADALARGLDDSARVGRVAAYLTNSLWQLSHHERAVASGRRALAIAVTIHDVALQATAGLYLGQALYSLGDYQEAKEHLSSSADRLEGNVAAQLLGLPLSPSVVSRHWLVWCLSELGHFSEAVRRGEEAVRTAEAAKQPYGMVAAYHGLGGLYIRKGDFDRAVPILERGRDLRERWDLRLFFRDGTGLLSYAYALVGRLPDALSLLEQLKLSLPSTVLGDGSTVRVARISEVFLLARCPDAAIAFATSALELAVARGERGHLAWALRDLAEIAVRAETPQADGAETRYDEALALAEELGMRPLQAHCHLSLGKLYRRTGRTDEARAELATAVAMLREMGMAFWLPEAERELGEAERHIGA